MAPTDTQREQKNRRLRESRARARARATAAVADKAAPKVSKSATKLGTARRRRTYVNWEDFVARATASKAGKLSHTCANENVARVMAWRLRHTFSGIKTTTKGNRLTVSRG